MKRHLNAGPCKTLLNRPNWLKPKVIPRVRVFIFVHGNKEFVCLVRDGDSLTCVDIYGTLSKLEAFASNDELTSICVKRGKVDAGASIMAFGNLVCGNNSRESS